MERLGTYEKIASFMQKEKQPYEFKRKYAQIRAKEFATECDGRGLNYHVSVGGLDSIILYIFLHEVCGIDVPGVSASTLEDKSIQRVGYDELKTLFRPIKQTNADRIRSMTDEELAANMMCPAEYDLNFNKNEKCNGEMNKNCYECLLKWLRAESEE